MIEGREGGHTLGNIYGAYHVGMRRLLLYLRNHPLCMVTGRWTV